MGRPGHQRKKLRRRRGRLVDLDSVIPVIFVSLRMIKCHAGAKYI